MDVDFWRVKSSGSENLHAKEVKFLNILQKKINLIRNNFTTNVKAEENQNFPAFLFHFPAQIILQAYYTSNVVKERCNILWLGLMLRQQIVVMNL
jgi:hypothetical protein